MGMLEVVMFLLVPSPESCSMVVCVCCLIIRKVCFYKPEKIFPCRNAIFMFCSTVVFAGSMIFAHRIALRVYEKL